MCYYDVVIVVEKSTRKERRKRNICADFERSVFVFKSPQNHHFSLSKEHGQNWWESGF